MSRVPERTPRLVYPRGAETGVTLATTDLDRRRAFPFSSGSPCRCGYAGDGVHRCHAGRDQRHPGGRCEREGIPRLAASFACLAGNQPKTGAVLIVFCDEHRVEAGFGPDGGRG